MDVNDADDRMNRLVIALCASTLVVDYGELMNYWIGI